MANATLPTDGLAQLRVSTAPNRDSNPLAAWRNEIDGDNQALVVAGAVPTFDSNAAVSGFGPAVVFAGTDYLRLPEISADLPEMTHYGRAYITDLSINRSLLGSTATAEEGGGIHVAVLTDGKLNIVHQNQAVIGASTATIAINTIFAYLVTYVAATGAWAIYINASASGSGTHAVTLDSGQTVLIGGKGQAALAPQEKMAGGISDWGLLDRVVTSQERADIFAVLMGPVLPSPTVVEDETGITVTTVAATGGTGPYTYQLYRTTERNRSSGAKTAVGASGSALSHLDAVGGLEIDQVYWYYWEVTDSAGQKNTSPSVGACLALPDLADLPAVNAAPANYEAVVFHPADSNTAPLGSANPAPYTSPTVGSETTQLLVDTYGFTTAEDIPSAIGGSDTAGWAYPGLGYLDTALTTALAAYDALNNSAAVLIANIRLGTNDSYALRSVADFEANIQSMIARILSRAGSRPCRIYLAASIYLHSNNTVAGIPVDHSNDGDARNVLQLGYARAIEDLVNGTTVRRGDVRSRRITGKNAGLVRNDLGVHLVAAGRDLVAPEGAYAIAAGEFGTEDDEDTTAPTVTSATINGAGTQLTVVFSETVSGSLAAISLTGATLSSPTYTGGGTSATFTIAPTVYQGQAPTLGYSGSAIEDEAGNVLAAFSGRAVTNNSTQIVPDDPIETDFSFRAVNPGQQITAIGRQYLHFVAEATQDGEPVTARDFPVSVAFGSAAPGADLSSLTWHDLAFVGPSRCKILVGVGGDAAVALTAGAYWVYLRATAGAEQEAQRLPDLLVVV